MELRVSIRDQVVELDVSPGLGFKLVLIMMGLKKACDTSFTLSEFREFDAIRAKFEVEFAELRTYLGTAEKM